MIGYDDILVVGLRSGVINQFDMRTGTIMLSQGVHSKAVTSMLVIQDSVYSAGLDGSLVIQQFDSSDMTETVHNDTSKSLSSLAYHLTSLYALSGEFEILKFNLSKKSGMKLFVTTDTALTCFTLTDTFIVAGAKSGKVIAWDMNTGQSMFTFSEHTDQVNAVIANSGEELYSASDDKTIIKWSFSLKIVLQVLKRTSSSALGHVGPVNSLSLCNGVLFLAGSDLTVRRWNTNTGKHEDVYFGHSKPLLLFCAIMAQCSLEVKIFPS